MTESKKIQIPCVGYSVTADWYQGSEDHVVLNLMGFTSSTSKPANVDMSESILNVTGSSVCTLEYTGHGQSSIKLKDVSSAQNFLEVINAFDWMQKQYPSASISVVGSSYGGFLATYLTQYRSFDKLVLRAPALYEPSDFYTRWERDDVQKRHDYRHNTKDFGNHPLFKQASLFPGKTLVVTHEYDDMCPPNSTQPFINAFNAETWEAKGFEHSIDDSDVSDEQRQGYFNKIAEWLKS